MIRRILPIALALAPAHAFADPDSDLAQAADAAADAAALPPAAPPPAAAKDDIDLASLGLDPHASGSSDDKLMLYGFADVFYQAVHWRKEIPIADTRGFSSGNLNLYAAKNVSAHWRFLAEVRMMYLPNGGTAADGTTVTTTAIGDPTNFGRPISWGGISIERAYIDYDVSKRLTIRAGRFLTPYGIWNIDHGSPAIIPAYRPYIIGEAYFPEHQTGLEAYGTMRVGPYKLGYHATLSNGRNPVESVSDPDRELALGGRLTFEAPWSGTFKAGVSAYGGRSTGVPAAGATADSYTERSYAADAQWMHGGFHVQGELIANDRHHLAGQRARSTSGFVPDGRQWGGYVLAGYRTRSLWNAMPFAMVEYIRPIDKSFMADTHAYTTGINFRPNPSIVLKLNYTFAKLRDGLLFGDLPIDVMTSQLAVVF